MTKTLTKKMEVTGRKPVESQTNDSSLPIWKTQEGRVQGAMWKHLLDDGKTRFTISVSRSYKDKDSDKWMNVHFFDEKDLADVHAIADQAKDEILRVKGMVQEVEED